MRSRRVAGQGEAALMKHFIAGVLTTLLVIFLSAFTLAKLGLIPSNADAQPGALERKFAHTALNAWLDRNRATQPNPVQPTDENLLEGMKIYKASCMECHGDPNGASAFGKSFYPSTPQLTTGKVPHDDDAVLFAEVSHGVRLTGMPSFTKMGMKDEDIWKVVVFVKKLASLPPAVDARWKAKEEPKS